MFKRNSVSLIGACLLTLGTWCFIEGSRREAVASYAKSKDSSLVLYILMGIGFILLIFIFKVWISSFKKK